MPGLPSQHAAVFRHDRGQALQQPLDHRTLVHEQAARRLRALADRLVQRVGAQPMARLQHFDEVGMEGFERTPAVGNRQVVGTDEAGIVVEPFIQRIAQQSRGSGLVRQPELVEWGARGACAR